MSVTAVPLRPIAKGSLTKLWVGIGLLAVGGVGAAWYTTSAQVAMATPPAAFLATNAKRSDVKTTPSGLQYQVIREGTGPRATAQDVVLVDYDGKLANGETFDASARHGGPATLPVSGLIPGWVEGLQLMNQGSKYRFWIPPELGYGPQGAGDGVIPPNALLVFDVDLQAIMPRQALGGMGGAMGGMGGTPHGEMPPGM
ncbi:FKBP-type peptidyl-prolyl cis-trans isomerase [Sphingomonas solaris]|uniref:Peptidyl-prolyl cis-trans isomerase n=1 Tax=Alterirhizorhabdus solaris TaxID=2529389 RepID=A0A558QRH6_9SPHN|nr:FKBP-type peptidyl-prolyl cis-trans isomerase [Sphingomonas solaris]TVV69735.1 FKBP-type peptidyl-prolyl cis-trans isomerase [Sphingomonas solaris]